MRNHANNLVVYTMATIRSQLTILNRSSYFLVATLLYRLLHLLTVGSFFRIMSKASCIASISFISCFPPTMCRVIIPIIYGLVSQVVINRALMSGPHLEQGRGRQEGGRRGDSFSFPPQENLTYLIHLLTYH